MLDLFLLLLSPHSLLAVALSLPLAALQSHC
jgi:hypothetical protein